MVVVGVVVVCVARMLRISFESSGGGGGYQN